VYGSKESNEGTRKDGKRRGLEGKNVMQKQRRREKKCGREKPAKRRRKRNVLKEGRATVNK
jgi:hypothetical protein